MSDLSNNKVCPSGKRRYSTKAQAKRSDKKNKAYRDRTPGSTFRMIPYLCCDCNDWHLTKREKRNAYEKRSRERRRRRSNLHRPAQDNEEE